MNLRRAREIVRGAGEVAVGVLKYPSMWMGLAGAGLMVLSQTEAVKSIPSDKLAGEAGIVLGILGVLGLVVEIKRES